VRERHRLIQLDVGEPGHQPVLCFGGVFCSCSWLKEREKERGDDVYLSFLWRGALVALETSMNEVL
jgi:hypothetical protein